MESDLQSGPTFQTTQCARFDHPEITIQFSQAVPVPGLETMLLDYFDSSVAQGSLFFPGQTLQIGWANLRMFSREDGALGVEEPSLTAETGWVETVDQSLMASWYQKEVAASLGLLQQLAFPKQSQTAIVCNKAFHGGPLWLVRHAPDVESSGWFVGCTDATHDHNSADNLSCVRLLEVGHWLPFTKQFLALPPGTEVFVKNDGRISAQVISQGNELMPKPGSYLHALNSEPHQASATC